MSTNERAKLLIEAERIAMLLSSAGVPAIVIGATALAAHKYLRFTHGIDLGINAKITDLSRLQRELQENGYETELHLPDAEDPLGGVINVNCCSGLVQIVNFGERFPAAIEDAFSGEEIRTEIAGQLRVMPIPQLVALKLYAGGWKSYADIIELLRRNPDVSLDEISLVCKRYRLHGWTVIQQELSDLGRA